jgi:hypothetical protein
MVYYFLAALTYSRKPMVLIDGHRWGRQLFFLLKIFCLFKFFNIVKHGRCIHIRDQRPRLSGVAGISKLPSGCLKEIKDGLHKKQIWKSTFLFEPLIGHVICHFEAQLKYYRLEVVWLKNIAPGKSYDHFGKGPQKWYF